MNDSYKFDDNKVFDRGVVDITYTKIAVNYYFVSEDCIICKTNKGEIFITHYKSLIYEYNHHTLNSGN